MGTKGHVRLCLPLPAEAYQIYPQHELPIHCIVTVVGMYVRIHRYDSMAIVHHIYQVSNSLVFPKPCISLRAACSSGRVLRFRDQDLPLCIHEGVAGILVLWGLGWGLGFRV